ncbi:hypothetical protein [Amycolatopsis sp. NBC_00438]|uniref:hypothetical protein n=1 Tax=Amycolatopsis sp. NBC_00438 TaxID=2903558 RepID=UPI002E1B3C1F
MPEGNPLVVDAKQDPDGPGAFTAGNGDYGWAGGIGLAESSMDAFNGIKDGDWVSGGLGVLSLAGEIAGAAVDPFGYLMSSVASFLMEHIQPLKDMLDSLAGNPPVIQSYADTWGNVSKALGERKTDFDNAVKTGTAGWQGAGADAYRKFATEHSDALSGAATVAGAISTVTMIMGQVVSFVRETVRQLIADLVGKLIAWVMEEVFSLGFGTPVVVAQASAAIAKWGKKIGELLKKLTDTIRKVSPLLSKLVDIFEKIAKVFGKVLGKVSGLDGLKIKEGGFVHKVPKGEGGVHTRAHSGSEDSPDGSDGSSGDSGDSGGSHGDADSPGSDPMNTDSSPDTGSRRSPSREEPGGDSAHAGDSSPTGDSSPSTARGDAPAQAGNSSPSARAGDSSPGDGSPSHTGDSSPSARTGDSSPAHAGDSSPSAHAGDSSPAPRTADSSPSPTRAGDNSPSHTGDSNPSARAGDSSPSHTGDSGPSTHAGDSSPSPRVADSGPGTHAGGNSPSHAGDSSPSPTRAGDSSPSHAGSGSPSHSSPAARSDAPGSHAGGDTPSSAAPPRADGTTSASGTAPAAPRTGDPGTQFPSPRGGDGAASGVPPQGGAPMGGGMPPGGSPGSGGGPGGGSPRTGGGWTGTPGSPGAHTPHVDAPGRPRPGGDFPEGRPRPGRDLPEGRPRAGGDLPEGRPRPGGDTPRPRTPDTPAPAARGFGPGTHGPDTRPGGHAPGSRPGGGPGHTGPGGTHGPDGHGPHENGPHENGPGHHDPDGGPPHHGEPLSPDEVNARHAESTPSGSSYHAGDPDMGDLPHRVQPDPDGRYTVDVHVTPDGHARIGDRLYTPEEFADVLRRNADYDGRPVRLIGCDASSNDFAHRLSRELDTEVMAPTKPAWTDAHGRVFSSDYEIGPDGKMRPRIPPDGEWNTHHPDGTTHRAGDDGFAPDTHHGDPHDVDADSAQHRGERYIDEEPVDIEHPDREPRASMRERINDDAYREKYYDGPNKNGEYSRKNADQNDALDERVPKIKEDTTKPDGEKFDPKSDDFEPANYHKANEVEHPATPVQRDEAQDLIDRRHAANQRAREAEADYQDAHGKGTVTDEIERERTDAHRDRTNLGEDLGEHAGRDAVADRFPPPDYEVKELPDPDLHGDNTRLGDKPGSGRFDQIYQVTGPDGQPRLVVVEAKGPNAGLGTRQGADGNGRFEQGHPKYVDSIIKNMAANGTEAEKNLAEDLIRAQRKGTLDYYVAKARVRDEVDLDPSGAKVPDPANPGQYKKHPVYGGYNLKQFDLTDR